MIDRSPDAAEQPAFVPPPRKPRSTRRSVVVVDKIADWSITLGGLCVIGAVLGIMVFLTLVVVPLFSGGTLQAHITYPVVGSGDSLLARMDEHQVVGVAMSADGRLTAFHAPTGRIVAAQSLDFGGKPVTSFAASLDLENFAIGFADGNVRFGRLKIGSKLVEAGQVPADSVEIGAGDRSDGNAVYTPITGNQIRKTWAEASLDEAQQIADPGVAIAALDYRQGGTAERPTRSLVTADAAGVLRLTRAETTVNMLTRKARVVVTTALLPPVPAGTSLFRLTMTQKADQVYVADRNGTIHRYDTRDFEHPVLAESVPLLAQGATLTAFGFLIGEQSLVVGGSDGSVDVYFRIPRDKAASTDGFALVRAHRLEPHAAPVVAFNASQRGKTFATADANGNVWLRHSTSEQTLLKMGIMGRHYQALALAPRADGLMAFDAEAADGKQVDLWQFDVPHPETTLGTLFGKVWYEGYPGPGYTWQSSSGTDSFEPKFSLVPLIFGTLKATAYSLLFAVPIALLAALYTSEFLKPRVRAKVKPAMEMMASLPSVVLGFIAALILAPVVETWIAAVILGLFLVPMTLMVAAHAWQFLGIQASNRLDGLPKLGFMFLAVAVALFGAQALSPGFEALIFAGDFKAWVNRDIGTAEPFLFLILLPVSLISVLAVFARLFGDRLRGLMRGLDRTRAALVDLGRWLAVMALSLALSWAVACLLGALGVDARGGAVDTYVQRNTLVVAFAMGFAVIPLIYTLADDALNAVPEHLRAASLACGATPWQTATRVILPTAISGVFAAMMIGMGRAVGETMIVVMAAGNTPLIDWNLFNGLRALSANIAVELPEAVKDDTLFRVLFLAALTLFAITFVINTAAEIVRQRFRKRAVSL